MNLSKIAIICTVVLATSMSYGQSATLTTDTPAVSAGSVLTLTASTHYSNAPAAVGWSVTLPEGWTFVATGGPAAPQVGPQEGATGTLEWAYASVPPNGASFRFTVKTAGKPGPAQLPAKVFLRADGRQQTIEIAPVRVSVGA